MTGYDPAYGARPLRRLVQREIGDRLARALLAGEVRDGDTVMVDRDGEATRWCCSRRSSRSADRRLRCTLAPRPPAPAPGVGGRGVGTRSHG